jgi:hypothetical protein
MTRISKTAVVALVLAMLLTCSLRGQVMQQVPGDALVVVKVNNLKATNDKVIKFTNELGIPAMPMPEEALTAIKDPLAALQKETGIQQGLDPAGELAFVFLDPATVGNSEEKAVLILIPVTDYKAFLSNWPDAKAEGEVSEIKFANGGDQPGYVASWGKYAALSPGKEAVSKKPAAPLNIPALASKELTGKDAILYVNFNSLRGKLVPEIQKNRGELLDNVEQALKRMPEAAKFTPVLKALLGQVINAVEEFMNDTQAATVGVTITPELGLTATVLAEFTPDTYIAKLVSGVKNTDATLLEGLPEGKYLFFGGSVSDPAVATKLFDDFAGPAIKELAATGPDTKALQDWVATIRKFIGAHKGQNFGMMAPKGVIGQTPLLQVVAVQSGDTKTMTECTAAMIDQQNTALKSLGVPGMESVKPTRTAAAKTVDGVAFDSIVTKVDMNPQDARSVQQAQMMNMLYGPAGQVMYYATVNDKLLTVSGVPDPVISAAIAAVKSNSAPMAKADRVKAVSDQLPKQRVAVVYVPVDDIITTVVGYAQQMHMGIPLQIAPNLPPVGAAISTQANAMRVDIHVPTLLVQQIIAAGMQAQMQMQQGGGGQPRGGGL